MEESGKRVQQFSAIMAVACEYGLHCKNDLVKAYERSLPPMSRTDKRREMMDFNKSWGRLEAIMKKFANINENTNPEWFDSVVDKLTEVIESVDVEITE